MADRTYDPVNQPIVGIRDAQGVSKLGLHTNKQWYEDPKHLLFSMARYKFVAKMLSGRKNVLEVGCGDAFNSKLVLQEVDRLLVTDIDPLFIQDVQSRHDPEWPLEARVHNILDGPIRGAFDAAYSLDVLEHVPASKEHQFLRNFSACLSETGVAIIGMPSLESQVYSKGADITGHINCKTAPDLKSLLETYFTHVFMFSMNDEIVHTGYHKMAHYLFALCCGKKLVHQ